MSNSIKISSLAKSSHNSIKNFSYIVLGGSGHLGRAIIQMLLQQDASRIFNLDLCDLNSKFHSYNDTCHINTQMATHLSQEHHIFQDQRLTFIKTDISDPAELKSSFDFIDNQKDIPPIKSVIMMTIQPVIGRLVKKEDLSPKSTLPLRKAAQITLFGRYNALCHAAYSLTSSSASNRSIIGLSSIFSQDGQQGHTAYSALMGALDSMTRCAAHELSHKGIRVNNICAGFFTSPNGIGSQSAFVQEAISNLVPYPKRFGEPHDLAHCVKFMIENGSLNGINMRLDGAMRSFP